MSAGFRTNHISPERNEIVLITRRFPPSLLLAAISVGIGIVLPTGSWLLAGVTPQDIALRTLAIAGLGIPVFYAVYYWRTDQLGGNALLANGTYVRGHVAWTDSLKYGPRDSLQTRLGRDCQSKACSSAHDVRKPSHGTRIEPARRYATRLPTPESQAERGATTGHCARGDCGSKRRRLLNRPDLSRGPP